MPLAPGRFHPLVVTEVRPETADAVAIGLAVPPALADAFRFTPGQYLTLRQVVAGEALRRSYSICSGLDEARLRIGVKRIPGGRFSGWATTALRPGDTLEVMPPAGRFTLAPAAGPRVVLGIAGGSGITPILSIARSLLAREPASRMVLLYGNRRSGDIMFREALEALKDRYTARFSLLHVLSQERQDLAALHGRLDAARIAALLPGLVAPASLDAAFLCGPEGLAAAATAALLGLGLPAQRIHAERFTASPGAAPPPPSPTAAAPALTIDLIAEGVTRRLPVQPGETVLEAGLRAGLDLPWSCRGGMCCTCRARVVAGEVAMAVNYSLQPWEIEAGFVLTCQSRPLGPGVVVDYDAA